MFKFLVIAACAFAVASSGTAKRQDYATDYYVDEASNTFEVPQEPQAVVATEDQETAGSHTGHQKNGLSVGSGLRSTAQGAADQASNAVINQHAAAKQAAYVAKNTLAQSAGQASATAQAALAGKQIILQGLEQQLRDAKVGLDGEQQQLMGAQRSAAAAQQAAQQAAHHVNVLTAALNAAQATSENAAQAASEAAGELAAQQAMVGAAKQRVQTLQEQLHGVRIDFEATQAAAQKAMAAAQLAQQNAAEAAAAAAAAFEANNPAHRNHGQQGGGQQGGHTQHESGALTAEYDAYNGYY